MSLNIVPIYPTRSITPLYILFEITTSNTNLLTLRLTPTFEYDWM
jgi:hypothetical protein